MKPGARLRLVRRLLVLAAGLGVVLVVAVYIGYRHWRADPLDSHPMVPGPAGVVMDRVHHTATRDGRTEWTLDARRARLEDGGQVLRLEDLKVVFYPREGGEVHLHADRGRLHTGTNHIAVQDGVVVKNQHYRLDTERLEYDHQDRRLTATRPVRLASAGDVITAAGMTVALDRRRAVLSGNVKGVFRGRMVW